MTDDLTIPEAIVFVVAFLAMFSYFMWTIWR